MRHDGPWSLVAFVVAVVVIATVLALLLLVVVRWAGDLTR